MSNNYILIGNFETSFDPETRSYFSTFHSTSLQEFFNNNVSPLANALGLEVTEFFDDTIVLRGNKEDQRFIQCALGKQFSTAHTDLEELDYARQCHEGTFEEPIFHGATPYKGAISKSDIAITFSTKQRRLQSYNA